MNFVFYHFKCTSDCSNVGKHVTQLVLHRVGVLLNCTGLSWLLSLSSTMMVCLKAEKETKAFIREKEILLAAMECTSTTFLEKPSPEEDQGHSLSEGTHGVMPD